MALEGPYAAMHGNIDAMCSVDMAYKAGTIVKKDEGKAMDWAKALADRNEPRGYQLMGMIYRDGTKGDLPQAVECFRKAAVLGDGHAMWMLGLAYQSGEGVRNDAEAAQMV